MEPNKYLMDNEASKDLKDVLRDAEIKFQLVLPDSHTQNLSERTIQTFKGHFKAVLVSLDPYFPIIEWDRLAEQSKLTLNLLRI